MLVHHHTKFGYKRLNGLGDIVWTNICWHFKPSLWIWQQSNFPKDSPAYEDIPSTQVWLQALQKYRRYSKNSHILNIKAIAVTLTLKTAKQFFCMTLHLMIIHTIQSFGYRRWSSSGHALQTKSRRMDRWTDTWTQWFWYNPPNFLLGDMGGGGIMITKDCAFISRSTYF